MTILRSVVYCLWSILFLAAVARADTIQTNDGKEIKGIVVEDYKDRVIISTADGELTVMKSGIKNVAYDGEEENLIKLAERAKDHKDYEKSYVYYTMALKANPLSKIAREGIVFLQAYLFRKEEQWKHSDMMLQAELDAKSGKAMPQNSATDRLKESTLKLRDSIGITIKSSDGQFKVETVDAKSAANEAGVRQGDLIIAIWGRLTGYMATQDAIEILLEKPTLEIKCTIERKINVPIEPDRGILAGSKELIGASFSLEFDGITISDMAEDGSAYAEGMQKGDLVTALDSKPTRYMPLKEAVDFIRNSNGDSVEITVRRVVTIWRKG